MSLASLLDDMWLHHIFEHVSLHEIAVLSYTDRRLRTLCHAFLTRPTRPWTLARLRSMVDAMPSHERGFPSVYSEGTLPARYILYAPTWGIFEQVQVTAREVGTVRVVRFQSVPIVAWRSPDELVGVYRHGIFVRNTYTYPSLDRAVLLVVAQINMARALCDYADDEEAREPPRKKQRTE